MSFDFYAHEWTEADNGAFTDCFARIKLLAKDNNDAKEKHKLLVYGKIKVGRNERQIQPEYPHLIKKALEYLNALGIMKPSVNLPILPPFSFFLQFTFKLATPYLSKDDEQFYPCENPTRKDKVFKVPMVSGSTWKGNMRWTARQIINNDGDAIQRLFGNDKDEKEDFHRGRLNFYPTFFDKISLEVINPHDRKTKAGTQPIYIESVPEGASGTFSLLYVPFDLMGRPPDVVNVQVNEDKDVICQAINRMMLEYGFSAKKSNGFGVVNAEIKGKLNDKEFSNCDGMKKLMEEIYNDR